ncbi:MAG: hypothetical protein KF724_04270 [Phycisphaeraceae bacterium]|nr:hypothetical protein [Phycisphaeraceae bacterium]
MATRRYVPAVGPKLAWVLRIVLGLFALLCVNSVYLAAVTFMSWAATGYAAGSAAMAAGGYDARHFENAFYLWMFLLHLVLGLAIVVPVVVFGIIHIANARNRPNKRAIRAGYALFAVALGVLVTGIALTRVDIRGVTVDLKHPTTREIVYWLHVLLPLMAAWLFVLHRLAGRRIKWAVGARWSAVAAAFAGGMVLFHLWNPTVHRPGPAAGAAYFEPSLARTATGNFIPAEILNNSDDCISCHADIHRQWSHSVHAFSSFNNPLYTFSVRKTREHAFEKDGHVQDARFCAGCHDPVPFFSGMFEDPKWDDPHYDVASDPIGKASISCTVCHSITSINGVRGNADYTISEPEPYPFERSGNPFLKWVSQQLIKAKPAFHKRTFLKPEIHRSAEFCSTCHKVFLPEELNDYKWLRGQNHYDSWRLSGVSGRGILSWYYPNEPQTDCNSCHMPTVASSDFGAKVRDASGTLTVRDHMFPSANTAIPILAGMSDHEAVIRAHKEFNKGVMRLDLVALREGGTLDGALHAPLRPEVPALVAGQEYMLDAVVRTVRIGHEFTQGTADSNEVYLDVTVLADGQVIGRMGGMDAAGGLDPWTRFYNIFLLDRDGYRIDRRNPEHIFIPLYNNQVPPGAGDVTHLRFRVPDDVRSSITVKAALRYRKFDLTYLRHVYGPDTRNDLPIMTLATDEITFPIAGGAVAVTGQEPPGAAAGFPLWQRWYDYAIGLLRTSDRPGGKGEFRQAEHAFAQVERLGRPEGPLGLARVQLAEGRVNDAVESLARAASHDPPAYPWSVAWFTGIANRQNGELDAAIESFRRILANDFALAHERGFDFSLDDRVLAELADVLIERARRTIARSGDRDAAEADLLEARSLCERALRMDPERSATWYILARAEQELGDERSAERALAHHARYKVDDNARDHAVTAARLRYPAANHAAEAIVIYDLQRPGAYELPESVSPVPEQAAR